MQWAVYTMSTLLVLVGLTCVTLEFVQQVSGRRGAHLPDPSRCNDSRVCTADTYHPGIDACSFRMYPRDRACRDACHKPLANHTHCDGMGSCVSTEPSDCLGYCTTAHPSACVTALPLNTTFWDNITDEGLLNAEHVCAPSGALHACELHVTVYRNDTLFAPQYDCLEYMDVDAGDALLQQGCLLSERFRLTTDLTTQPGAEYVILCVIRYACSSI